MHGEYILSIFSMSAVSLLVNFFIKESFYGRVLRIFDCNKVIVVTHIHKKKAISLFVKRMCNM